MVALVWLPAGPALGLEKVVLQLKWMHQFQFAGYYAAVEKGFYRDEGLEVELREALPGQDAVLEVTEGRAEFGVGTSSLILMRSQGKPVVLLAVIYQHSPFVLISTAASGVRDVHDLATRPIMIEPDAVELLAYFKNEGVDFTKMNILPHSFDLNDLLTGKVDALAGYATDEPYYFRKNKIDYLMFTPRAGGIDFYGDNLFTTDREIKERPERVKAFLRASLKGWNYALAHPEEIVEVIRRRYSQRKDRDQLMFEAEETARLVHPELIEPGYVNPGRWQSIQRTYMDLGMMKKAVVMKDFIYERNPQRDLRWLYWSLSAVAAVALASGGWTLLMARVNRELRLEVAARKKAEARVRAQSEAKSRFLSVLAHEVRTPLSGILSSLWVYKLSRSQAERDEVVEIAKTSSSQLLQLVDNTLDHSKLETARMEVNPAPVAVVELLNEIVRLFSAVASSKGIWLRSELAGTVPALVNTDGARLRQILSNLISNAVKFTVEGGVTVRALLTGQTLVFRVEDTGPGVTAEQAARIFEPYVQGEPSVAGRHGGTGLGLSISLQLAQLLGGGIRVESEHGSGATFVLEIPLQLPPQVTPAG
jgi:signal transduction histidine kinase